MARKPNKELYTRLNIITISAVYFLILVGGIVRSTGSGMGCPDWPKCFGSYVPPTSVEALPDNYKELYAEKRIDKNIRLSNLLSSFGFDRMAQDLLESDKITEEQPFNATKTWIEYLNRLIGVAVGLLIIACVVVSYGFVGADTKVFVLSFGALVMVVFQGWIGSLVVSTNLLPGMITFHMILAVGLLALLIAARFRVISQEIEGLITHKAYKVKRLILVCIMLFFAQVLLGTQVREAIDVIAIKLGESRRGDWINELGIIFKMHRSYSLILLALHLYLVFRLMKSIQNFETAKILVWGLLFFVGVETLTGAVLAYFSLPYLIQPVHLLLALLIFGVQYYLYLMIRNKSIEKTESIVAS